MGDNRQYKSSMSAIMPFESLPDENWLPVVDYEDLYLVSDFGRISRFGKILKPGRGCGRNRHRLICLSRNGRSKTMRVHRLVLTAFVGPCPKGMQGLHWDDDAHNNHLSNLYWGTPGQNMQDKVRNGKHYNTKKTHCPKRHEYTPKNTYIGPDGWRACRACRKQAVLDHHKRRKLEKV